MTNQKSDKVVEEKDYNYVTEDLKKRVGVYPMMEVQYCPYISKKVPDIINGGERKRKYGVLWSMSCIPQYHDQEDPTVIQAKAPMMLVDSDSIEDLEEMMIAQVKGTIKLYKDVESGEVVPPTFEEVANVSTGQG